MHAPRGYVLLIIRESNINLTPCATCYMLTANGMVNFQEKRTISFANVVTFILNCFLIYVFNHSDLWQGWLLVKECPHLSVFCGVPAVVMCSLSRQRLRLHLKTQVLVTKSISASSLSSFKGISSKAEWRRFVRGEEVLYFTRNIFLSALAWEITLYFECVFMSARTPIWLDHCKIILGERSLLPQSCPKLNCGTWCHVLYPSFTNMSPNWALSQNFKSACPKCAIGPAQMSNV